MARGDVARLETLAQEELRDYLQRRLHGQPSRPPVAWSHGEEPEDFVEDAYALSTNAGFKQRLKVAVRHLLQGWRPELGDRPQYAARLMVLAGALGVEGGADILRGLAVDPALEEILVDDEPLSNLALRTLLDFPGQEREEAFWESRLADPRYFDSAYLAMMLLGPGEGLRHLPGYVSLAFQTGLNEGIIESRLSDLAQRLRAGPREGLAGLSQAVARLPAPQRKKVEAMLRRSAPEALDAPAVDPPRDLYSPGIERATEAGILRRSLDLVGANGSRRRPAPTNGAG